MKNQAKFILIALIIASMSTSILVLSEGQSVFAKKGEAALMIHSKCNKDPYCQLID
jgi:hypothetical protein